jgi:7-carboxy-7-deazaguanine synthase
MQVTEIFRSIQGESTFAGLPCLFLRLSGCNLRCDWCDSEFTFTGGRPMSLDQVEAELRRAGPAGLIEITGGEPMLQEREVVPLMQRLLAAGYTVLLETSGERSLAAVPPDVHKIVDVKCPHSGAAGTFRLENLDTLTARDELKFVLTDRFDYEFARDFIRQYALVPRVRAVLFSPAFRKDAAGARDSSHCLLDPQVLAGWILEDGLGVRLGLQVHKFIWDPATRGV